MRRWRLALSTVVIASLWVAAMVGPTGYTLGAFTGSTSAANTQFKTANSFGTAPVASPITPYNTASSVALNTKITISFSEAMDQATSDAAFSLAPLSGANSACQGGTAGSAVAGSFAWENNTTMLVFSPGANLTASSCYQVSIGTGATSSASELHLAAGASSAFQTGITTATTNPIIVPPTSPAGGGTGVSTNNPIQLTFSEAMNTSTTQAAFSLASCGATTTCPGTGNANVVCWVMPVSSTPQCPSGSDTTTKAGGAFTWSGAGQNILTFTPNGLAPSTYYAMTVATSATDLYGNTLASNAYSAFQFATAAGPDTTPPAAPTVITPSVSVWTNNATYTLTGQVEANALVRIYSGASLVASIQLNGGVTNFSLEVALQVGADTFTVTATDAAGNVSPSTAVSTITRSDPKTNPSVLQLSPGSTSVTLVVPYSGDADSNATATVSWVQAKCPTSPPCT
ncbi:MAG: Ig-like domain-containing protein, partial [Chloroflexota bacterium]